MSTRLITGERDPSTEPYLPCATRKESLAAASLSWDVTETMKVPPPPSGAVAVGATAATRAGGSGAAPGAGAPGAGDSDNGALALALAEVGELRGDATGAFGA